MRQRTTWSKPSETPRQATQNRSAATERRADIYTMNQDHPQPTAVEYENGDPDAWAETPVSGDKMSVNAEYEGDHVKRNELNFGEFREDTWKHKDSDHWNGSGKYDNAKVSSERKASAAERVARAILRTDVANVNHEKRVEDTTFNLMSLPVQALVATLRHMDGVSPDALPQGARYKRSLACVKLASRMLGAGASESSVTKLGTIVASIDDPTLKSILRTVAESRVAQEQQDEKKDGHTSQEEQADEEPEAETEGAEHTSQEEEEEEEEQGQEQQGQQETVTHGLCPEDAALLDQMLKAEGVVPAPVPAAPMVDDLQALFPEPAPAAVVPMMASGSQMPEISFEDEGAMDVQPSAQPNAAVAADALDDLFSDNDEVRAQREIVAARQDQSTREGGYNPGSRTASARGVRKLGQVQGSKATSEDDALAMLWERPVG